MSEVWLRQMRRGFAELCILVVLNRDESYGYEILASLRRLDALAFSESTLYPTLAKMMAAGLLTMREGPSDRGKSRRYYRLTHQGRGRLQDLVGQWEVLRGGIDGLIAEHGGGQDG